MSIATLTKRRTWLSAAFAAILAGTTWLAGQAPEAPAGTGQSFTSIQNPAVFKQDLYAASGSVPTEGFGILGGVAFAPSGAVWSAECLFLGTRLHRFAAEKSPVLGPAGGQMIHAEELIVDHTGADPAHPVVAGGCGLVNHPNGKMYSNSTAGLWAFNATTGELIGGPYGHAGNALGIAVDPQGSNHIVYAGDDCHFFDYPGTSCTMWDYDPATNETAVFSRVSQSTDAFIDGIYFDPTGNFLFAASREEAVGPTGLKTANHALQVIHRPAALKAPGVTVDDRPGVPIDNSQWVQNVGMTSEPDGVAFHAGEGFVVTLNESYDCQNPAGMLVAPDINVPEGDPISCLSGDTPTGGTMTRFDFGNGYGAPPTGVSTFAAGGFRGDLLQVGADGCIYGTQGRQYMAGGVNGTRYDNGYQTAEQSIFRICGGFVTPPGVAQGSVAGTVYKDANRDSVLNGGDSGLGGVTVTLVNTTSLATMTTQTAANGTYTFNGLAAATYSVSSPATTDGLARETESPLTAVVAPNQQVTDKDFGYVSGRISGFAYIDWNRDGIKDSGDTGLEGVSIDLSSGATTTTGPDGSYSFTDLEAGSYNVSAPADASGKLRSTPSPLGANLAEGEDKPNLNFGYVPGGLSGFAYVDANGNGMKDGGEPGIPDVVITLGSGTQTTAGDGSYGFGNLDAGTHSVSAPSTAAGYARSTASPFPVALSAGQVVSNVNFGYVPGGLSGFAYADTNRNGVKDSGEAGLGGVTITLAGYGTQTTASNGFYSFSNLTAGSYNVSAPATAAGLALDTNGVLGPSLTAGQFVPDQNFGYVNGSISGFAYVDSDNDGVKDSGEPGIGGVTITLNGSVTTTTASNGAYVFPNLTAATYSVSAPSTTGSYNRSTPSPLSVVLGAGVDHPNVNFGYRPAVAYATYTQGGWGAVPQGNNPGMILKNNFATVYPNGVTIGGSSPFYYLKFTSQAAIEAFLPAGGTPKVLTKSATNPTSSNAGVFAGQVLALKLSMDFSAAGVIQTGLSVQKVAPGYALAGYTLTQVLALANQVLSGNTSGLPAGVTVAKLNDLLSAINQNYDNGTTNNGVLVP